MQSFSTTHFDRFRNVYEGERCVLSYVSHDEMISRYETFRSNSKTHHEEHFRLKESFRGPIYFEVDTKWLAFLPNRFPTKIDKKKPKGVYKDKISDIYPANVCIECFVYDVLNRYIKKQHDLIIEMSIEGKAHSDMIILDTKNERAQFVEVKNDKSSFFHPPSFIRSTLAQVSYLAHGPDKVDFEDLYGNKYSKYDRYFPSILCVASYNTMRRLDDRGSKISTPRHGSRLMVCLWFGMIGQKNNWVTKYGRSEQSDYVLSKFNADIFAPQFEEKTGGYTIFRNGKHERVSFNYYLDKVDNPHRRSKVQKALFQQSDNPHNDDDSEDDRKPPAVKRSATNPTFKTPPRKKR